MIIQEDLRWAGESGEFANAAELLRYVAAINPLVTRKQFITACSDSGYKSNTSANRFRESRLCSLEFEPLLSITPDGCLV
jgi:hypothetical protein